MTTNAVAKRDRYLQEQALTRHRALIDEEIAKAGNRIVGMKVAADRLEMQVDTRTGMPIDSNLQDARIIRGIASLIVGEARWNYVLAKRNYEDMKGEYDDGQ